MSEWYKEWFNSVEYLKVYKHRNEEDAQKLINLIFNNIEIEKDADILDAACGAGRHSINLAKKGFNVTAFDLSDTLLQIANKSAKQNKVDVEFIKSDIREFHSTKKFSLIINLFTSFGYFESDFDNFAFFKNAYNMLKQDGYLAFDFLNKNQLLRNIVPESIDTVDDLIVHQKRQVTGDRINKKIVIEKDGESKSFDESVKLYDSRKIISEFEKIGFRNFRIFGNFDGSSYNEDTSERLIIICQK